MPEVFHVGKVNGLWQQFWLVPILMALFFVPGYVVDTHSVSFELSSNLKINCGNLHYSDTACLRSIEAAEEQC